MENPSTDFIAFKKIFLEHDIESTIPLELNVNGLDPIIINNGDFNPENLDFTNAYFEQLNEYTKYYAFSNPPIDDYPDNHPVSMIIKNFNQYIYSAFRQSNNTSIRHLHLTTKGLDGGDGYRKAIGAIGEGIFAKRVASIPSISMARMLANAKMIDNFNPTNQIYVDLLTEHKYTEVENGYSFMIVNHTDRFGNPIAQKLKLRRNSLSRNMGFSIINTGFIAYEVKTYNPSNTASNLWGGFKEGIEQTIERAFFRNVTAGVLVFDKTSFTNLYNSSYHSQVEALLNRIKSMRNSNGDQAVFLKLEENLWIESNNAFYSIKDKIENL
ncbi:hypothetical protein [Mucilaginibacter terrae]|uniref:Uncharacterized protein n=1 Tax=Mucilaginibacter terrae TaxID=1955052 RepID=A0ABU3H086_9SPHI|nr:hypothetical protein [Mucilaginibacter terrae]MDT3405429.1 hypothetical protein [Mucilaginibacter terrae]